MAQYARAPSQASTSSGSGLLRPVLALAVVFLSFALSNVSAKVIAGAQLQNSQRALFLDAINALEEGKFDVFLSLADKNQNYLLYPYLKYYELRELVDAASSASIKSFIDTYSDYPLSRQLRYKWLFSLAKRKRWREYLNAYTGQNNTKLKCYQLRARLAVDKSKKNVRQVYKKAKKIWMVGSKQPKECIPLFKKLEAASVITTKMRWQRIDLAMARGNLSLVRFLSNDFNKRDKRVIKLWARVHRNPGKGLQSRALKRDSIATRKIIIHGIKKIARRDAPKARKLWRKKSRRYHFSSDERGKMIKYIALRAAYQFDPNALKWLKQVKKPWIDSDVRIWRTRAALRDPNWHELSKAIKGLKKYEQKQVKWRYWGARAKQKNGHKKAARSIFEKIARKTNYYGFLAADQVSVPYTFDSQPLERDEQAIEALKKVPGIQRARELYLLGRITDARREWNRVTARLKQTQLKTAAILAHDWQWHDNAITTLAKTGDYKDLNLRFPTPFRDLIYINAQTHGMDPSLIFGVARRESAFNHVARSNAGALGLMQLLPGTARLQSRLMGLSRPSRSDILSTDHNILLGSAYLNEMIKRFSGNQVLATAAYNAGPNRVERWIPKGNTLPADVWVDTVPYKETRKYVRAVMAYSTIFDWKLDAKITPLKDRMFAVGRAER